MKKLLVLILGIVSILGIFTVNATEYSNEMVEVYNRAYENGIISETTIDDANLYNTLTNKELADIMNKYAENVIGLTPNTSINCQFDDISDLTTEEQNTIIKSCQLGLMPGDLSRSSFLPNEKTNRATFGSALSRVLWGNKYEGGTPYYANHLNALKAAGIMNIITNAESTKEVRGYVMLMLMRSETSNAVVDCDDADIAFACFDPDYTELYENCPMECRKNEIDNNQFSAELTDAYIRAYEKGIISASNIDEADLYNSLTNLELADIMNKYAENVIGLTPNTSIDCQFDDISDLTTEEQNTIIKSCQLGLMPGDLSRSSFLPNEKTNRATFGSALSRALRGNNYEGENPYYTNHLNAIKAAGIMNQIANAESTKEIRGYVLLMLMRSETSDIVVDCDDADIAFACFDSNYTELYENCPMECRKNETNNIATLLPGNEFKAKIRSIIPESGHERSIKSIKQTDEKKEGITDENLISGTGSKKVRAWYDNTNDQGILYYYTDANEIYMNENSEGMFQGFDGLIEIPGLSGWNTSNVINMNRMFGGCTDLTDISALNNWNTKNVTDMGNLFYNCRNLTDISALSKWDTSNVKDMSWMFVQSNINDISALSGWNVSNVENMRHMFQSCNSLTNITPINNWNTDNVINMAYMFENCSNLSKINLSNWDTSNVNNMDSMFHGCSSLEDISTLSGWNVSNVTNMLQMFDGCNSLTGVNLSNWNTSNVTNIQEMFYGCNNLERINLSGWNTSNVTSLFRMFDGCSSLEDISTLSGWNVNNVTDMSDMFNGCSSLTDISALSNWNVSNVTDMGRMFNGCSSLTDISALSNRNVSKVTDLHYIFNGCSSLTDISTLSNWNVSKVTNMSRMFSQSKITDISALSGWNVSNVTNMGRMFEGCSNLINTSGLSNWNTSNVTSMQAIFKGCSNLAEADLSNWDTSNVNYMGRMFEGCNKLKKIYTSNKFTTKNIIHDNDIFSGCIKLVGGNGTTYDASHTDAEYARIDTTETPGYFTDKNHQTTNNNNIYIETGTTIKTIYLKGANSKLAEFILKPTSGDIAYLNELEIKIDNPQIEEDNIKVKIDGEELESTSNNNGTFTYHPDLEISSGGIPVQIALRKELEDNDYTINTNIQTINGNTINQIFSKRFVSAIVNITKQENKGDYTEFTIGVNKTDENYSISAICMLTGSTGEGTCLLGENYANGTFKDGFTFNVNNSNSEEPINYMTYRIENSEREGRADSISIEKEEYPDYFKVNGDYRKVFAKSNIECLGMDSANINHIISGDIITLKWDVVDGDTIQIAIFNPKEEIYKNLGAVNMSDKKFDYKIQWTGLNKFVLTNGCRDYYYSIDVSSIGEPITYTVTINTNNENYGTISKDSVTGNKGEAIKINGKILKIGNTEVVATPQKADSSYNYTFTNWTNNCGNKLNKDCIIIANFKRTSKTSNGGGGGGGGGSTSNKDNNTNSNTTGTNQNTGDNTSTQKITTGNNENIISTGNKSKLNNEEQDKNKIPSDSNIIYPTDIITYKQGTQNNGNPAEILQNGYTREMNNAYQFAHKNGITTTNNIENAKMNSPLTRIAMAKMLSYYAINILGQKPDTSKNIQFNDVTDKQNSDYNNAVTLSYQLGIMGQGITKFRPNDEVTRAEFTTALSRMLYNTEDGKGNTTYYEPHMKKLYNEGIITKNDPNIKEMRGYVMIMLMRSSK